MHTHLCPSPSIALHRHTMIAARRIPSTLQSSCSSCSAPFFNSFASACGSQIRLSLPRPAKLNQRLGVSITTSRSFQTAPIRLSPEISNGPESEIPNSPPKPGIPDKDETTTTGGGENVPWFLRVETPAPPSHPFDAHQSIPELPEDPPSVLSDLLTHLSVELGIVDLTLLDLRPLDPPPAIGGDTIMILGNARSERHLHSSADKICRWLRSTHQMSPFADGLLGRNELRLKNRRKRRRGKLVSSQMGGDDDEQSKVNWVCVNIGKQGLVIQLFTPEKREEVDLEALWGRILNNYYKRKEREVEKIAKLKAGLKLEGIDLEAEAEDDTVAVEELEVPSFAHVGRGVTEGRERVPNVQTRSFHSSTRLRNLVPEGTNSGDPADNNLHEDIETPLHEDTGFENPLLQDIRTSLPTEIAEAIFSKTPTSQETYYLALKHIAEPPKFRTNPISSEEPTKGNNNTPDESYQYPPQEPSREAEILRQNKMRALLSHMTHQSPSLPVDIPELHYLFLRATAHPHTDAITQAAISIGSSPSSPLSLSPMLQHLKQHPIGTYPVPKKFQKHDRRIRATIDVSSYTLREYHTLALTILAMSGYWPAFWNRWKSLAYLGVRRDEDMYRLLLGLVALARNQNEAVYCGRRVWWEMQREVPPVRLGVEMARVWRVVVEIVGEGVEFQRIAAVCGRVVEGVEGKVKNS